MIAALHDFDTHKSVPDGTPIDEEQHYVYLNLGIEEARWLHSIRTHGGFADEEATDFGDSLAWCLEDWVKEAR